MTTTALHNNKIRLSLVIITCILILITVSLIISIFVITIRPKAKSARSPENSVTDSGKIIFSGVELDVDDTLPINTFSLKDFVSHDSGRITYNGDGAIYGIDVSSFQGNINWTAVKASGIDFAIIRLGFRGSGEGGLFADKNFQDNITNAAAAGINVGVYFFSQAITIEEAEEEAEYVLEVLDGQKLQYPIFFDWEPGTDEDDRTNAIYSSPLINEFAVAFCNVINNAGYESGVYFNGHQGYLQYDFNHFDNEVLWLAEYGNPYPKFYYYFDMWQYSCTGTIDGIDTPVDLNIHFTYNN